MGNGYPVVQPDPMADFGARFDAFERRLRELEQPTGTQLAGAVAELQAQIANQVAPEVGQGSATNFASSTSYTDYASFSLTVPDGFTRALIVASGFVNLCTGSTGGDRNFGQVLINGSGGPESISVMSVNMAGSPVAAFNTASLTGLSAGQTIPVIVRAHLQVGPNSSLLQQFNSATIAASAIYLR